MFALGVAEPLEWHDLERHAIVWLGGPSGENNLGMPATHPLCSTISRVLEHFAFVGTWVTYRQTASLREFERKATLLRLEKASWVVDPDQSVAIRAHKVISESSLWPFPSHPGLPHRAPELLALGAVVEFSMVRSQPDPNAPIRYAPGEHIVFTSEIARLLVREGAYALCVGRTHTENSPGLSVIGPHGLDPRGFVPEDEILIVHRGDDAGRAWSHRRVNV